jgi:hypothetical protein
VDYRKLNEVTKKDCFPLPWINDTLNTLAGAKWFSTLNLKSMYWQVGVHLDNKEKTILNRSRAVAVHSHALWPLQCSGDIQKANGDSPAWSHKRFMSCVLRQCDHDWPHFRRAPAKLEESVWAVLRSPPKAQSGEMPTLTEESMVRLSYCITWRDNHRPQEVVSSTKMANPEE